MSACFIVTATIINVIRYMKWIALKRSLPKANQDTLLAFHGTGADAAKVSGTLSA